VIKVMHGSATSAARMHLLREACMLEALQHPGVVRVYESGVLADRRTWCAYEYVAGPTVASVLSPGSIDRVDAIAVLRDLAEVLVHAHQRGVIHCGLRPGRIVLTGRSRGFPLCVSDWSDARAHDAAPMAYHPSAASWHYTSPELACGDAIDDRTDVFALGVIAYQLLTGALPFDGPIATANDGTTQHIPTEVHCPDAPRELTQLVDQMLSYDRWDRPSGTEVRDELDFLADALSTQIPRESGLVRLRRPRWTPPLQFDEAKFPRGTRNIVDQVVDQDSHGVPTDEINDG
jgi:serine/threonine protein kinase